MRMIDADKLLELMKDQKEREIGAYAKGINAGLNIVKSIINDETQTPTAYDVDKVVEQLNKAKKYNLDFADKILDIQTNGTTRHFICLEDAIETVKDGGMK